MFNDLAAPATFGQAHISTAQIHISQVMDLLATGEESARLGHLVAVLALGAKTPSRSDDPEHGCAHDGSVEFPVRRPRIPASGRRPDFLGIPVWALR